MRLGPDARPCPCCGKRHEPAKPCRRASYAPSPAESALLAEVEPVRLIPTAAERMIERWMRGDE